MKNIKEKEEQLELKFQSNYILYMSQLVASNAYSVYKCYEKDCKFSLDDVIRFSKDSLILQGKEKELFYNCIKDYLKEKYNCELISKENKKLELKERN